MQSVISNIISSCFPWCLTCMSTNDWSHQSATASNLKEAIINKATPCQAENRVQKGGEMETIGYTINRNNIRLIFFL